MRQYTGTCPTEMSLNGSVGSTSSWPDSRSHTTATGQLTLLSCSPQLCSKVNCSPCVKWRRSLQFLHNIFRGNRNQSLPSTYVHMCRATKGSSFSDDISSAWKHWTLPVLGASARGEGLACQATSPALNSTSWCWHTQCAHLHKTITSEHTGRHTYILTVQPAIHTEKDTSIYCVHNTNILS